jgi:hypothetical protein
MNFFTNYDHRKLVNFLDMKEDESPKILIISGPYNSGKSTLRTLLATYHNCPSWFLSDPSECTQYILPPKDRSIMLVCRLYKDALDQTCKACREIMWQEKRFRNLHSPIYETFSGNQTIIELTNETSPDFSLRNDIIIINTKKIEVKQVDFKILECNFRKWISDWRNYYDLTPVVLQLILLKKFRQTILNSLPKDVFRLLIHEIISTAFQNVYNRQFLVTLVKI